MQRLLVAFAALCLYACSTGSGSPPADTSKNSEIPITSKSAEAIAHFKTGRELNENSRTAEAIQEFETALKLDPNFVQAQAHHGNVMPDPEGLKELEQANMQAAALPQAERLLIETML